MIVACGQMEATTMAEAPGVWPMVERLVAQASQVGADLLVLPECTYPAYWLESVERYMQPDIERSARVLERFADFARGSGIWIVAGFVEENAGELYNSAAVFDRSGELVGIARKSFLWDCDNRWFAPGTSLSVFDSEFGRMGLLICADARAPEIAATLATQGAEFVVEPTAWVNAGERGRTYLNVQAEFMIRARAIEFGLPFACATKSGREDDKLEYVGQSQIVDAAGRETAKAPIDGEHLIYAEIAPGAARLPVVTESQRARLLGDEPPYRASKPAGRVVIPLRVDSGGIADAIRSAGGRAVVFEESDLRNFAPARCAAMDGAQVLVYDGAAADESLVRTRAAENRVFVIATRKTHRLLAGSTPAGTAELPLRSHRQDAGATSHRQDAGATSHGQGAGATPSGGAELVVAPDGSILWRASDSGETLELDLAQADDKRFTPETDLWEQRRAACFRLPEPRVPAGCGSV